MQHKIAFLMAVLTYLDTLY